MLLNRWLLPCFFGVRFVAASALLLCGAGFALLCFFRSASRSGYWLWLGGAGPPGRRWQPCCTTLAAALHRWFLPSCLFAGSIFLPARLIYIFGFKYFGEHISIITIELQFIRGYSELQMVCNLLHSPSVIRRNYRRLCYLSCTKLVSIQAGYLCRY